MSQPTEPDPPFEPEPDQVPPDKETEQPDRRPHRVPVTTTSTTGPVGRRTLVAAAT